MDIYENKRLFVENELTNLITKTLPHICKLEYDGNEKLIETVSVYNCENEIIAKVNVTFDNLIALTRDVLESIIGGHNEN